MAEESTDWYFMKDAEEALDRGRSTIRAWVDKGWLPEDCRPFIDEDSGYQCWTGEQIEKIKAWMQTRNQGRVTKSIARYRDPAA